MKFVTVTRYFSLSALLFSTAYLFPSCEKLDQIPNPEKLDSAKKIISVVLKNIDSTIINTDVTVNIGEDSVIFNVPGNVSLSVLVPAITFKGVSITPATGTVQDFTNPVKYTITAADSTKKEYVIKVIRRDVVYIGATRRLLALDSKNGHILWKDTVDGNFTYSTPLLHGDVLYAGSINGYMYAFNARNGKVIWKQWFTNIGIEGPATLNGNTLYVGSNDDYFTALDAATGEKKWAVLTRNNVSTKSVVYGNKVIFGSSDGYVYALDAANGSLVWKYATGGMIVASSPTLSNGVVFIGSRDYYLHAIDANTGLNKWKFDAGVSMEQAASAVANGVVYAAGWYEMPPLNTAGSLYAINEFTGQKIWQALDTLGFSGPLCLDNGTIYISADDLNFYAVNAATGDVRWSKEILPNGAGAVVKNGIVYVGGGGTGFVYAFDAVSGAEIWTSPIPDIDTSTPAIGRKKARNPSFVLF